MRRPACALLALATLTACGGAPARPDAAVTAEAPAPSEATPDDAQTCERATTMVALDAQGRVDLGPFLPALRDAFGEDLLVCASPTAVADEDCDPLLEGVFGDATIPHGFYLFHASDFTLDITVLVDAEAASSVSRTACDPPLEELSTEPACEDRVHSFAEGLSEGIEPLTRSHDELDRRMIHSADPPLAVCQGLVLTHMIPNGGAYEDKILFQHSLLSVHLSEARVDSIGLSALMLDLEGRSEVDDVLVYVANTMREVIDGIDPSTRSSRPALAAAPPR